MSEHNPIKTAEDWIEYIKSYKRRNGSKLPVAIAVPTKDFLSLVNDFKQVCDSNNKRRAKAASTNKIAEKDKEIRRLKRALWIAHEYKAKFKRWWLHLALDCEAREIRPDTKTINRISGKIKNCEKSERKCLAKAEEYK